MTEQILFDAICDRLMLATGTKSLGALADCLGFKPAAFSNRRKRGALPREEIDALIEERGLSPAWVYTGRGAMFAGDASREHLEKELNEVVDQISAISLHNTTVETLKPLLRGIVWKDADSIEAWLESVASTSDKERRLLSVYRSGGPEIRSVIDTLVNQALHGSKPVKIKEQPKAKFSIKGSVGQLVHGDVENHGPVFHTSGVGNTAGQSAAAKKPSAKSTKV